MSNDSAGTFFSRKQWQESTHFHPLSEPEVLSLVAQTIVRFKSALRPLVLLDLDSTLYEVGPRTLRIIQEWLPSYSNKLPLDLKLALENLAPEQVGYSLKDTFANLGFPVATRELETITADLKTFWWDRFFSSDYLPHDRPYPGAVEYANHLYDLGAEVCYLTGRSEARMRKGTEANLLRDGFPFHMEGTLLLMRQEEDWSDERHKSHQVANLAHKGFPVASFENEPVNLVTLSKLIPHAAHIFVDTVCSDHGAEPGKNLYSIKGFSSFQTPPTPKIQ
ncbi:MAG: HAD family hydrolase [Proteobacteria bacterium]|nr:HAD family hydrolase [Pseudomonadota bacterium]